jgi:hypothetical protein
VKQACRALLFAAAISRPALGSNDVAVYPGQATFDAKGLPLVCVEIGTIGAAVPFDSLIVADRKSGTERRLSFADSLYNFHSQLLTAYTRTESLALPIFHLPAGQYVIRRLEFVVNQSYQSHSLLTFGVGSDQHPVWFEVKPGCVNYIGGIDVQAQWANAGVAPLPGSLAGASTHSFSARTIFSNRMARDAKWASDKAPCMGALPWAVSLMRSD